MTVVSTQQDTERLTLTIVAELAAAPERVWDLWADPRQLERWWGPPTWPATFVEHDLVPGGRSHYVMTGPDGEQAHGWWEVLEVDPPRGLRFRDGFADETGAPNPELPTTTGRVELVGSADGTRMTVTTEFGTAEHMEQLAAMGMVEGMTSAMGQMDGLLVPA
ncbi:SRPBCC family protein [Cellulomonas aerilata]|uniref:Activator of HSP90 ATPase n=1 Tax=Cellulomonas aerilata TaxID=515326 RepID=A0A512D9K8_9CELL|nr:SRPBCC domain-containing protein [Cellulomonas aerilata]GEO33172.1 activator of HSP90 ATPase [Cellulomonas aerilata]